MTEKVQKKRKFHWIAGAADGALRLIRIWYQGYYSSPLAKPTQRKIVQRGSDPESKTVEVTRYEHNLSFTLNQLDWLAKTFNEENPETSVSKAFNKALKNHKKQIEKEPNTTAPFGQWYDFSFEEVRYVYNILERIKYGRLTPGQEQEKQQELADGDW